MKNKPSKKYRIPIQKETWFKSIVEIILFINIISLFIGFLYSLGILSKII